MEGTLYTDGGARGNPGPAGIGVVLIDSSGTVVAEIAEGIGRATNNAAEYQALVAGLELALERGFSDLRVRLDSELVVNQVLGRWKIRNDALRPLAVRARSLLERFDTVGLEHVPRSANRRADELANRGMDSAAEVLGDDDPPEQSHLI